MADCFGALSHSFDILLEHLRIHGVHGLDAGLYILLGTIFLWLCAAVPTAIRAAFFRDSPKNRQFCEPGRRPAPRFHYRLKHKFSTMAALYHRWKSRVNEALI